MLGNVVHVCVSSRKLNNLYCLSAGTQPNFDIPIPVINNTDIGPSSINGGIKEIVNVVQDDPKPVFENKVDKDGKVEAVDAVEVDNVALDDPNPTSENRVDKDKDEVVNAVKVLDIA